jgi:hypothetical protein
LLSEEEKVDLKDACVEYGRAWRLVYSDRLLSPKGHVAEKHVSKYVDMHGNCGVFGEDGAEVIHLLGPACGVKVRTMANPEKRLHAKYRHIARRSFTPAIAREVRKRLQRKSALKQSK